MTKIGDENMEDLRETIANRAHESWSGWMRYLFEKSQQNDDGTVTIPAWAVERWQRQMTTPYAELSEQEKESDRKEADEYLLIMTAYVKSLVTPVATKIARHEISLMVQELSP